MHITLFPWQQDHWHSLWRTWREGRLPHALLIKGMQGIGKKSFMQLFMRALFCEATDSAGLPCHHCPPCCWLAAQSHPDVLWIEPEKAGQAIKVDQIREVIEFSQKTALQGKHRVVIIYPADSMNLNAANALLKTLEEPSPHTFIMLVTHETRPLPATIRSRCQCVTLHKPDHVPLESDPLRNEVFDSLIALSEHRGDALIYAAKWQDTEVLTLMDYLFSFLLDLLRLRYAAALAPYNVDYQKPLQKLSQTVQGEKIVRYVDYLQQIRQHVTSSFNLNKQLLWEDLLLRWVDHVSC